MTKPQLFYSSRPPNAKSFWRNLQPCSFPPTQASSRSDFCLNCWEARGSEVRETQTCQGQTDEWTTRL